MMSGVAKAALPLDDNGVWKDEVEYVETDGSACYFDTGVTVKPTTHVVTCLAIVGDSPSWGTCFAGGGGGGATILLGTSGEYGSGYFRTMVSDSWSWNNTTITCDKDFHVWNLASGSQRIDGLAGTTTAISDTAAANSPFILGGRKVTWNSGVDSFTKIRIRSCQIYDGDTLVKDYVADYQSGVFGLTDRVDGSFNPATGGTFGGSLRKAPIYVDYVESTSDQLYLATGVKVTPTTRIVADMAFRVGIGTGTLLGCGGSDSTMILFGSSWSKTWQYTYGSYNMVSFGTQDQERHVWDIANGSQKLDGEEFGTKTMADDAGTGCEFTLAGRSMVAWGRSPDSFNPERIWGCRIYDGVALLRDLKPCYANHSYALKDDVTGKIIYATGNSGDTQTLGIRELTGPTLDCEYEAIGSIIADGSQYIDTRYKPANDMRVQVRMAMDSLTSGTWQFQGWANPAVLMGVNGGYFAGYVGADYTTPTDYTYASDEKMHTWDFTSGSQKIDGVTVGTQEFSGASTANDNTFYLFARHKSWSLSEPDWFMKARIFSCKMWNGGTMVRDFVPARVGGRVCLWDRVRGLPYFGSVGNEFKEGSYPGLVFSIR